MLSQDTPAWVYKLLLYFDLQKIRQFIMFHYYSSQNSTYLKNLESISFAMFCKKIIFCSRLHLQPPENVNLKHIEHI